VSPGQAAWNCVDIRAEASNLHERTKLFDKIYCSIPCIIEDHCCAHCETKALSMPMNLLRVQVHRLREQLHKAEAWLADLSAESKRLRVERDAAALELATLRNVSNL
jgi:hypothetical protein